MSVFVDTGLFYALQGRETARHETASHALDALIDGPYGRPITSDYVVDEAATLVRSRSGDPDQAVGVVDRILGRGNFPDAFSLRHVDPPVFDRAVETFERYGDQGLSFTDATTVAIVSADSIDHVLAFDDDFDGVVDRLAPSAV